MGEKKKYTISSIAQELGVSKTTVSRAISGKGRIGKATRERILSFIEEHDYRPNAVAKGLAQNRTYNLGLVLPFDYAANEAPFFKDCMTGICEAASENNYDVLLTFGGLGNMEQIHRIVTNRKVDGIILSRAMTNSSMQKFLKEKNIPFVVIGPSENSEVLSVDNHNREGCKELTEIMLMKGFYRLALLGGDESYLVTESRMQGFCDAHQEFHRKIDNTLVFMGIRNHLEAMKAVEQALRSKADGIVCMDDFIAGLVLGCLREKGIQIPECIKVASMYDSTQMEYNMPAVTSLHFDTKALGKNACMLLLKQLGRSVQLPYTLNYEVILRESTK